MDTSLNWHELLKHPAHDHLAQVYTDPAFVVEAVSRYVAEGLRHGEAALLVGRPQHRKAVAEALERERLYPNPAIRMLDADECLVQIVVDGTPEWTAFHKLCGGAIAELRLSYPHVRAWGEMVDILWQRGERHTALHLEHFWNELLRLQSFSLLCSYKIDPLEADSYGGALESVCRCHTHLIPMRDYSRFNQAVTESAKAILDQPLAQMLLELAANHRPHTDMPLGQAALIWLKQNMPRTADRVLDGVRLRLAT